MENKLLGVGIEFQDSLRFIEQFSNGDFAAAEKRRPGFAIPAQTPRSSDKSARDLRSGDSNLSNKHDKDKGVNVQVLLRCRPLSEDELRVNTPVVISCHENRREVCAVQNIANKQIDRTFMFDKVFGPTSQQKDLYDQAVSPIVNEVLEGYNCTIFAYGQTGTGKTYTMEGGARKKNGEFPNDADLLAPEECTKFIDDKTKKPIALMEDGKGGVFVRGLEEEIVCTANEIYKILEKGSAKRRTAETLLNKQSSRSHSIFSITIHIKEVYSRGEEMIKCGKLNLVDLAGSENISRSGAREGRAREAGEINKSLLTLGRVINALVEHSGHVPYSTLDYAHRAKNIKNKPEVNQKMMKSAVIKDLYSEIDRLKQEVYAAREKNGIYIPRDRYLNEEAEKKAMAEKIERMELLSDSKDKQLMELQELYNSQQLLTGELSDKLEKTEKKLEETEHTLFDLEERHRQAMQQLKKRKKALVERAFELRAELENAASECIQLICQNWLRKDKIEDGNRIIIQKFQSQLTQQLEALHKTVAASTTQQEQQLKDMEEDMQSFVSTKAEATEELRGRLAKLKTMYGSGIKALDDITGELDGNSHSTFGHLNSEVAKHSTALEDLMHCLMTFKVVFTIKRKKLTAYAQQQREAHSRAVETTRSISKITVNFFKTLDGHASKLTEIVEEAQTVNDQKLSELEKKFEECAANEERQLLEKVAELLASSNARKKNLVQMAVHGLRESAASRTSKLQQEMATMQESTSSVKAEWTVYMDKTETHYLEDTAAVENQKKDLGEVLQDCLEKAKMGTQQWRNAQESLLSLENRNVASVESIVRGGMEANQNLRTRFSSAVSSALEDVDVANKNLLSSIDHSLQLDHEACGNLDSMIVPCCGDLRELNSGHYHKIVEITENAGKCLLDEYVLDEQSCSTPRKRSFNLPSMASIEELRTPAFDELLKSFWESKSAKQANGDVKHIVGAYEGAQSFRDSRVPLTAIN
ncbi:Kinesin-like protein KIN-5D [Vitis vinifera]|uniref:Kinesin-like protein n=1 Tax=Vitis vinifera TaxID=29760 RepID=A0A438G167_VITVI|nr:Kinesin-like protein KIN-5D [Vitis vinifera]